MTKSIITRRPPKAKLSHAHHSFRSEISKSQENLIASTQQRRDGWAATGKLHNYFGYLRHIKGGESDVKATPQLI